MKKTRDSNMELLRIVSMLLIMMVHASYRALPQPTTESLSSEPLSGFLQLLTECFTVVGVDVFVLLSGWYGIRPRVSRFAELLFQVLFFGVFCLGVAYVAMGQWPQKAFTTVLMLNDGDYWFVKTYIALYLFSPVLNVFVEKASQRQFAAVLLGIFTFQWVYGWVFEATAWLRAGYSLPSFMALYLLARYMNVYRPSFTQFSRNTYLVFYLVLCSVAAVTVFLAKRHFNIGGVLLFYNSPTVIVAAVCLLLFFSKLSLHSRLINWIAGSVLAVYLTHSSSFIGKYYDLFVLQWHDEQSRLIFLLCVALLIVGVFSGSILIDKLRLLLWRPLERFFHSLQGE